RGLKLTDAAYTALKEVVTSKYYAHFAKGKFGKLIIRESWFKEFDGDSLPVLRPAYGSNAWNQEPDKVYLQENFKKIDSIKKTIQNYNFVRKPFSHQITGIEYLLGNDEGALLDEMG